MSLRACFVCVLPLALGAASAIGCGKRALGPQGPGTGTLDAGAGGGSGGAGGATGGGLAGAGGATGGGGFAGAPVDLKWLGATCASSAECVSGFCIDGVCCDRDCRSPCLTCGARDSLGTCVYRTWGDFPRTADACPVEVAQSCGNDGTCDGAGACRLASAGSLCGGGACDGNAVVGAMACDGRGACTLAATQICVPYTCDPATARCRNRCATDADCVGTYCEGDGQNYGSCHMRSLTATCTIDSVCASGHCWNGVCCNTACADPCLSCNLQSHEGSCTPRPDGCPGADAATD
jgi:hypothetical protein